MSNSVQIVTSHVLPLLTAVTATGAGSGYRKPNTKCSLQAKGRTTAGVGAATVVVQVSNTDVDADYISMGTISLTLGTTSTADGFVTDSSWTYIRGNVTAISGTGAAVTLTMGI